MEVASNADVVRAFAAAFNRRDMPGLLACCDPAVEAIGQRSEFEGPFRGHAGLERAARDLWVLADDYAWVLEEVLETDGGVLVLGHQRGRARGSGIPIDLELAGLFSIRAGRIVQARFFASRAAARRAVDDSPRR